MNVPQRSNALMHEVTGSGETVLYDGSGNQLLVLNETAAALWILIDGKRSVSDIVGLVEDTIDHRDASVREEIAAFFDDLAERELITWR